MGLFKLSHLSPVLFLVLLKQVIRRHIGRVVPMLPQTRTVLKGQRRGCRSPSKLELRNGHRRFRAGKRRGTGQLHRLRSGRGSLCTRAVTGLSGLTQMLLLCALQSSGLTRSLGRQRWIAKAEHVANTPEIPLRDGETGRACTKFKRGGAVGLIPGAYPSMTEFRCKLGWGRVAHNRTVTARPLGSNCRQLL
jgi:hypothetical protein